MEPQDYLAAYGTLQLDPASGPMSTKTPMWLASCSKLVTTIAALQCIERDLFSLDEPADVDRLLPEWKDPKILTGWSDDGQPILQAAKVKITVRMLLNHTSGFGYDFMSPTMMQWRGSRGESTSMQVSMAAPITAAYTTPLAFEPGTAFAYGGGVDLVGLMIARTNDCTLEAYMRRNIFNVLGMHDTSFHVAHGDISQRLMPFTSRGTPDGPLVDGYDGGARGSDPRHPGDEFGGCGLLGSAEDYLKLLKSILRNDAQLLKPESVDLMFAPCIAPSAQAALNGVLSHPLMASLMISGEIPVGTPGAQAWSYGIAGLVGLEDTEEGLKAGRIHWVGGPGLKWWIDREGGTCGIFATQLMPAGEGRHAFLNKIFQREGVARLRKAEG